VDGRLTPREPLGGWSWWWAPVALVVIHAVTFAIVFPIDHFAVPMTIEAATLVLQAVTILFVVWFARRRAPGHARERLGLRPMLITPGRAALWIIGSSLAAGVLIGIYNAAVPQTGHYALFDHPPTTTPASICLVAGAVVGAPIAEELLFRGVFYQALRTRLNVWPAVLISSAVFGLMHWVGGDPLASAGTRAIIGVFLCLLLEYSGSLYPGMAFHAMLNSWTIAYVAPHVWFIPLGAQVLALVVAVARSRKDWRRKNAPTGDGTFEPIGSPRTA
jgi:CAAX protease family protein